MIKVTKEQITEVLKRLKDYSYWMYYGQKVSEMMRNAKMKHKDHEFYLQVRQDGLIEMTLENGVICVYDTMITTCPLEQNRGIENLDIKFRIVNISEETEAYRNYFNEVGIFVSSYFQRANAFIFFCKMQEETIDRIALYLESCNEQVK